MLGGVTATISGRPVLRIRRREWLLLGILLLEAGRPVTVDRLADLLWGDDLPRNPRQTLQVYVSRLRTQLGPAATLLRFESEGYRFDVEPTTVDAHRFTALVNRADTFTDPAKRSALLSEALELWRGPLLADAADDRVRDRLGGGLEQQRLTALESRIHADLELGREVSLLPELTELTDRNPMRERLIAAHMTVLHRSGRTGEAVELFQRCARRMVDEYGLDVGDELRRRYVAILRGDPALRPPDRSARVPAELPPVPAVFVGRESETAELCAVRPRTVGRAAVIAVDGMAGVGKTALVVHIAHRIADRYPDGRLYVDLHGFSPDMKPVGTSAALDRMLRSLGVAGGDIPQDLDERAARFRSVLADRRVLIILDNVPDADHIRRLIPAAPGCLVLVTSRRSLAGLDDDGRLTLRPLPHEESGRLFREITQVAAEDEVVEEIAARCGHLPLALRVVAAQLHHTPHRTVTRLLDHLRDNEELVATDAASAVTTAMAVSYRNLSDGAKAMLRFLSLVPVRSFDLLTAAAVADVSPQRAEQLLGELVSVRMLEADDAYRFHDLVRRFAGRMLAEDATAGQRRDALRRLMHHCLATANLAAYRLNPGRVTVADHPDCPNPIPDPGSYDRALEVFDDNRALLTDMVEIGHMEGMHTQVWRLCVFLTMYYQLRHHYDSWHTTHRLGLDSAVKLNDVHARARMTHRLAGMHQARKNLPEAIAGLLDAERLYAETTDVLGRAAACNSLGSTCLDAGDDPDRLTAAVDHLERALRLYRAINDATGEAMAMTNLGRAHRLRGGLDEATDLLTEALKRFEEQGRVGGKAVALHQLGCVHADSGRDETAMAHYDRAMAAAREAASIGSLTDLLADMGKVCLRMGRHRDALRHHEELDALLSSGRHQHAAMDVHRMRTSIAVTYRANGLPERADRQLALADAAKRPSG
ncbi:DNA-binding SARP family transcriptional activator [Stackebrandtia endophytica]|uniref:DNA-binding SARP family transcriptional activator n=1 Tax=Stackebrandtia endophytica TaxID=1496996 RepID=A0A543B132_9ACTN|nr:DNA-binding SARP family transcriptional activator [Stackebrandtia endophytica]